MQTKWVDWLAAESAAGRGGIVWPDPIVRGLAFSIVVPFPADVSGADFAAELRTAPDATGAALAAFTVTVGSYAAGVTPVTFALTDTATATLPTDDDGNGLEEVVMDALYLPAVGDPMRSFAVVVPISGAVTEAP